MAGCGVRVGPDLAVTRYAGWDFFALCRVDGVVLAADGLGLCRLGGDADDGRAIAACLELPPVALDETAPVRVRDIRVRGEMSGGLCGHVSVDGGPARRLPLGPVPTGGEGRFPVGRDGEGRVWRIGIENRDGGAFRLHALSVGHAALDRR